MKILKLALQVFLLGWMLMGGAHAADPQVYYLHNDHLGTPRVVTDSSNQIVWQNEGEPFGATLPDEDPASTGKNFTLNLRFPGQYYDKETGRNQNFFRDYNPETGRYVQSDPIGLQGGPNTYAYVEGNPVSSIDPEGLMGLALPGLGGLGLGGAGAGGHSGLGGRDELGNPTGNWPPSLDDYLNPKPKPTQCHVEVSSSPSPPPPPPSCETAYSNQLKLCRASGSLLSHGACMVAATVTYMTCKKMFKPLD